MVSLSYLELLQVHMNAVQFVSRSGGPRIHSFWDKRRYAVGSIGGKSGFPGRDASRNAVPGRGRACLAEHGLTIWIGKRPLLICLKDCLVLQPPDSFHPQGRSWISPNCPGSWSTRLSSRKKRSRPREYQALQGPRAAHRTRKTPRSLSATATPIRLRVLTAVPFSSVW